MCQSEPSLVWIASSGCATAVIGSSKRDDAADQVDAAPCAPVRGDLVALKYARAAPSFSAIAGAPLMNATLPLSSFRSTSTVFRPSFLSARYCVELPGQAHQRPRHVDAADLLRQRRVERARRHRRRAPGSRTTARGAGRAGDELRQPEERGRGEHDEHGERRQRARRRTWRRRQLSRRWRRRSSASRCPRRLPRGSARSGSRP